MLVTRCICSVEVTVQTKGDKIYRTQRGGCSQHVGRGDFSTVHPRGVVGFRGRGEGAVVLSPWAAESKEQQNEWFQ